MKRNPEEPSIEQGEQEKQEKQKKQRVLSNKTIEQAARQEERYLQQKKEQEKQKERSARLQELGLGIINSRPRIRNSGFPSSSSLRLDYAEEGQESSQGATIGSEPEMNTDIDIEALISEANRKYALKIEEIQAQLDQLGLTDPNLQERNISFLKGLNEAQRVSNGKIREAIHQLQGEYSDKYRDLNSKKKGTPEFETKKNELIILFIISVIKTLGIGPDQLDKLNKLILPVIKRLVPETFEVEFTIELYSSAIHAIKDGNEQFYEDILTNQGRGLEEVSTDPKKFLGDYLRDLKDRQDVKDEAIFEFVNPDKLDPDHFDTAIFAEFQRNRFKYITRKESFPLTWLHPRIRRRIINHYFSTSKNIPPNDSRRIQPGRMGYEEDPISIILNNEYVDPQTNQIDTTSADNLLPGDIRVRYDIIESLIRAQQDPQYQQPEIFAFEIGKNIHSAIGVLFDDFVNDADVNIGPGNETPKLRFATFGFGYNGSTPEIEEIERRFHEKIEKILDKLAIIATLAGKVGQKSIDRLKALFIEQVHILTLSMYTRDYLLDLDPKFKQRIILYTVLMWQHICNISDILRKVIRVNTNIVVDDTHPGFNLNDPGSWYCKMDTHMLDFDETVRYSSIAVPNNEFFNGERNCSLCLADVFWRPQIDGVSEQDEPCTYDYSEGPPVNSVKRLTEGPGDPGEYSDRRPPSIGVVTDAISRTGLPLTPYLAPFLGNNLGASAPSLSKADPLQTDKDYTLLFNLKRICGMTTNPDVVITFSGSNIRQQAINIGNAQRILEAIQNNERIGRDLKEDADLLSSEMIGRFMFTTSDAVLLITPLVFKEGGENPNNPIATVDFSQTVGSQTVGSQVPSLQASQPSQEIQLTEENLKKVLSNKSSAELLKVPSLQASQDESQDSFSGYSLGSSLFGSQSTDSQKYIPLSSTETFDSNLSYDADKEYRDCQQFISENEELLNEDEKLNLSTHTSPDEYVEICYDFKNRLKNLSDSSKSMDDTYGGKRKTRKQNKRRSNRKTRKLRKQKKQIKPIKPIREKKTTKRHKKRLLRKSRKY